MKKPYFYIELLRSNVAENGPLRYQNNHSRLHLRAATETTAYQSLTFKFVSLAAMNNKTLKWKCEDCNKEVLYVNRWRHEHCCKRKIAVAKARNLSEEEKDIVMNRCFRCHEEGHWASECRKRRG